MKYVISWFERPQGSPIEYENAHLDRSGGHPEPMRGAPPESR